MALRFIDSMAHYGTDVTAVARKWTIFAGAVQGSGGRRNAPYIQFNGAQGARKTLTHQNNYIQGVAAIMQPGAGQLGGAVLSVGNNETEIAFLRINADATLSLVSGNATIATSTLAVADSTGSWHYYEFGAWVSASGGLVVTTATAIVDGRIFCSGTATSNIQTVNLIDGSATINQVGVTTSAGMGWMDYYCLDTSGTDFYNGTSSSTNTTFLNDVEIDALFPAVDVTTNFSTHGGDGTHAFSCVNEDPPDYDTSYVFTTATGTEQFNYQPISGFTGTILGAQYSVLARKDNEGTRAIKTLVGTAGVESIEFLSSTNFLPDYYVYFVCPLDTDLGVAWTPTVYNAEKFGVSFAA